MAGRTDPVPRYELEETRRELENMKAEKDKTHRLQDERITGLSKRVDDHYKDINTRLEEKYYTKDGVRDQFRIELSDYKALKGILVVIGMATLGLVFAVIQQYLLNQAGRN